MTERRATRRYDISLPISIRPNSIPVSAQDDGSSNNGKTRNISPHGIYFTVEPSVAVGAGLDITVMLSSEIGPGPMAMVRARATVVRVEDRLTTLVGVAAVIEKYEIVRKERTAS